MSDTIIVETLVNATVAEAWHAFTTPEAITRWNFASPEWHCPWAKIDLREGGRHSARMEARDGSMGFDYEGTYEEIVPKRVVALRLDDGRLVRSTFEPESNGTRVCTAFDADNAHPRDVQREGWQAILDNYAIYVARNRS